MNIEVRTLQISKSSWSQKVQLDYEKKISYFCPTQIKMIRSEKDFLKNINDKDFVIICDEGGEPFSSKVFANRLGKVLESGKKTLYFVVGGPFGLPKEVVVRANLSISLSHFVMNQEVALSVLLEQIFRAFTILNNHPYHND